MKSKLTVRAGFKPAPTLLTAALALALALTFSCSLDDGGSEDNQLLEIALTQGQSPSSGSNYNSGGNSGTQRSSSSAYTSSRPSSSSVGKLTVSGYPYAYSNTGARAYTTNPSSVEMMGRLSASGIGDMTSSGVVDWGLANIPRTGTYTIVLSRRLGSTIYYYKATGVSITNGGGSVSWSRFSEFK